MVRRDSLVEAVDAVRAFNLGEQLTIPQRENTIVSHEVDRKLGYQENSVNRDGYLSDIMMPRFGFLKSVSLIQKEKVVIMGGGAASRCGLAFQGVPESTFVTHTKEILAQDLSRAGAGTAVGVSDYGASFSEALKNADLLVDATPVGMYPNHKEDPILMRDQLHPGLLFCDLVYNPPRTRLLEEAAATGCGVLNGVGMLVHQGALAFQLWTGRKAPVDLLQRAVLDALKDENR